MVKQNRFPAVFKNTMRLRRILNLAGAITAAAVASLSACATQMPVQVTRVDNHPYSTPLAALLAAANRYNPRSIAEDREFLGMILQIDGRYYYTVAEGIAGANSIAAEVPTAKNDTLVLALWHTHGGAGEHRQYFSPTDTKMANRLQLPFFLADYTGQLKVYRPNAPTLFPFQAKRLGLQERRGAAIGELVADGTGCMITVATSAAFVTVLADLRQ